MKILNPIKSAFILTLFISSAVAWSFETPSAEMQNKILRTLSREMVRLDGEALITRKHRTESFQKTADRIADESLNNSTLVDFYSSFQRLNATYTNLHSGAYFPAEVEKQISIPWHKSQSVWLFAEVSTASTKFKVEHIDDPVLKNQISEGDEIVAINGRSIDSWLTENFLYCKYPLTIQCNTKLESNLLSLYLSWKGDTDLIYSIKHLDRIVDVNIKFSTDDVASNPLKKRCDYQAAKRYSDFKVVHAGQYACLFQKIDDPTIALLRITSFQYKRSSTTDTYKSVAEEVAALEKVWVPLSGQYKNLIVDVLNNGGGNLPIAYYQILFKGKFQEQYYQTKKIPEFEDDKLRAAMIWDDSAHELQYQLYLQNGLWESLKYGEFTPPEPMFCADQEKPCLGPMFEAKPHEFNGKVHIMLNENCVSSCDGFVWALKEKMNADLYGFYQAADSTYSRLRIDVIRDDSSRNGFKIKITPQYDPLPENLIIAQVVATSRSTDADGNVFSGNPIELKEFIPYKFGEFYPSVVLKKILDRL